LKKLIELNLRSFLILFCGLLPLVLEQLPHEAKISLLVQLVIIDGLHVDSLVPQSVENVVRGLRHDPPVRLLAAAVIKRVPLSGQRILSERGVVTATHSSIVVRNSVAIID